MREKLLLQCCGCGRIVDLNAKATLDGLLCRFCVSDREGRCLHCGFPGEPWTEPSPRYSTLGVGQYCEHKRKLDR